MAITTIVPAILTKSPTEYKQIIKDYFPFTKRAHIDISDGSLTSNTTISESAVWWPRGWTVDIHMMTTKPSEHIPTLLKLHPNLILFHAEAKENLLPIFETIKKEGMKVGVVIMKNIYPGAIKEVIQAADHALIFSGGLGKQGNVADLLLLEKVALINQIHPGIEIGWDGGANLENVRTITHAGVSVINVGGFIAKSPDRAKTFEALTAETEKENPI